MRTGRQPPAPRAVACQDVVELVTDFLEGALPPGVRSGVERHLRACRTCAAYLEQVRTMLRALGRLPPPALGRAARADLVDRFRRWTAA
jgi:anti-sigma factor RsiW